MTVESNGSQSFWEIPLINWRFLIFLSFFSVINTFYECYSFSHLHYEDSEYFENCTYILSYLRKNMSSRFNWKIKFFLYRELFFFTVWWKDYSFAEFWIFKKLWTILNHHQRYLSRTICLQVNTTISTIVSRCKDSWYSYSQPLTCLHRIPSTVSTLSVSSDSPY